MVIFAFRDLEVILFFLSSRENEMEHEYCQGLTLFIRLFQCQDNFLELVYRGFRLFLHIILFQITDHILVFFITEATINL